MARAGVSADELGRELDACGVPTGEGSSTLVPREGEHDSPQMVDGPLTALLTAARAMVDDGTMAELYRQALTAWKPAMPAEGLDAATASARARFAEVFENAGHAWAMDTEEQRRVAITLVREGQFRGTRDDLHAAVLGILA